MTDTKKKWEVTLHGRAQFIAIVEAEDAREAKSEAMKELRKVDGLDFDTEHTDVMERNGS